MVTGGGQGGSLVMSCLGVLQHKCDGARAQASHSVVVGWKWHGCSAVSIVCGVAGNLCNGLQLEYGGWQQASVICCGVGLSHPL